MMTFVLSASYSGGMLRAVAESERFTIRERQADGIARVITCGV